MAVKGYRWLFLSALGIYNWNLGAQEPVTWANQISCLVYSHCTPCHHQGGVAPFALEGYEQAFAFRYSMENAISTRHMPPWPPAAGFGHFAGDRSLTSGEIQLFRQWIEEGAPEGDPEEALEVPVYTSETEITGPDFRVRLPVYTIPDLPAQDLYRCFVIPTNESADRFITAVEIIPGNREVVHHVILFQDTTGVPEKLDLEQIELGYTCFGGTGSNSSMVSGWVPGSQAYFAPEGMGILLRKGATLVAQIHYPEGSAGQKDSTLIQMRFSSDPHLRRIENLPALNHFFNIDRPLFIPANSRQTFYQKFFPVPFKVIVTGIAPHAHLICESMKAFATTLAGDTIPLIDIPHWDFHWQGFYAFQKPVVLPAFSTLHGIATYNNTTSNPHLPSPVPRDVSAGEATTDEMMIFFLSLAIYEPGDEEKIIDTVSHQPHYLDCETEALISDIYQNAAVDFHIGPNPVQESAWIRLEDWHGEELWAELFDMFGKKVISVPVRNRVTGLMMQGMPEGMYVVRLRTQRGWLGPARKLVVKRQ